MSRSITVTIPGPPTSWERTTEHKGRKLTSAKMRAAQKHIRSVLAAEALRQRWQPVAAPVRLTIAFVRNRKPDAVPDASNYVKQYEDCANGILWDDDRRVVELRAVKRRPGEGEAECTTMTVEVLDDA